MLFSKILTPAYTHEAMKPVHNHISLQKSLAQSLADYLVGETSLLHASTGRLIRVDKPIAAIELAVFAQNKAYELTASEMEQRVFTLGGPKGDGRDALNAIIAVERIDYLAESDGWLYFEPKNTIKHRAQKEAYRLLVLRFLKSGEETDLLREVLESVTYEDWRKGRRSDLWAVVRELANERGTN
jgi:hypothetical protein